MRSQQFTKVSLVGFLMLVLSACALPGHRQVVNEEGFYLSIKAPNKKIKESIRFNATETKLIHLPENVRIELSDTDSTIKRKLIIKHSGKAIVYDYQLNGRKTHFGIAEQQWFKTQIPKILNAINQ